jgi:hypothetical protein
MKFLLVLFLVLYGYASIRYHIGKELGYSAILFVLNKALAWWCASVLLISLLPHDKLQRFGLTKRATGLFGYTVALVHILVTFYLLSPSNYPKFFTLGALNIHGWTSVSIGFLSLFFFSFPLFATWKKYTAHQFFKLGRLGVLFNVSHVFSIGFDTWFPADTWPYYLPPITLIFVIQALLILLYRYVLLRN